MDREKKKGISGALFELCLGGLGGLRGLRGLRGLKSLKSLKSCCRALKINL